MGYDLRPPRLVVAHAVSGSSVSTTPIYSISVIVQENHGTGKLRYPATSGVAAMCDRAISVRPFDVPSTGYYARERGTPLREPDSYRTVSGSSSDYSSRRFIPVVFSVSLPVLKETICRTAPALSMAPTRKEERDGLNAEASNYRDVCPPPRATEAAAHLAFTPRPP